MDTEGKKQLPDERSSDPRRTAAGEHRRTRLHALARATPWLYLLLVLAAWAVLRWGGDRWWPATFALYGPRWVWAVPALLLLPVALIWRRRSLAALLSAVAVAAGPIMGLCLPSFGGAAGPSALRLRVLTCNTYNRHLDADALASLIRSERPDVVALQEWVPEHRQIGRTVFGGTDYHLHFTEDAGIASRYPIESVEIMRDEVAFRDVAVRCRLVTPAGPVTLVAVHLQTPRWGFEAVLDEGRAGIRAMRENTEERRNESLRVAAWAVQAAAGGRLLVAGDFNLPTDSTIYRQAWAGGFTDAFDAAGFGYGYTKYTRLIGARIDHVLAGPGWRVESCRVGPHVGSDHRPVIAEVCWAGGHPS